MNSDFFRRHREALLEKLGSGAVIVLAAYSEMQQKNDAAAPFEQEANFWYLSGLGAPEWWLIMDGAKLIAVAPEINAVKQAFDGSLDPAEAKRISGADRVVSRDEAMTLLRTMSRSHSLVYTVEQPKFIREHATFHLNPAQTELFSTLDRMFDRVVDCYKELAILRTIKDDEEVKAISHAIDMTVKGFELMKNEIQTYKYEYEAEAKLTYEIRRHGADGHAYQPIVGGGENACTLHYVHNNALLKKRSLLLFDVGARVNGYAADISRTYAFGEPTKRGIAIHDAVRQAQAAIIDLLVPGLRFSEYQKQVDTIMKQALLSVKLDPDELHEYMPHAVGHGLGVDVHDPIAGYESLQPGMVLTVEPGIYVPQESIGVRIEDDILITQSGHKNLSSRLDSAW